MSISRLSSSSAYRLPPSSQPAPSPIEAKKFGDAPGAGQQQGLDELLRLLQELVKQLSQDGFEPSEKGAGGGGGGGGGGGIPGGGGGGGGGGIPGGGGGGGGGGIPQVAGPSELGPTDLGLDSPSGSQGPSPSFSGAANADAVAQEIAQDATNWNYDNSGGKTWEQTVGNENTFDGSKSGVCTDMALEAAQRFEAAGVDARIVMGETDRGNHAWVEYKGADGQWKGFDPTTAACTDNTQEALNPYQGDAYHYGQVLELHDEIPTI